MNLATRCPACGTVFRVVPDQLKVSEGWVRCGRCSEVFDAAQRLFELDSAATPAASPPPQPPPQAAHEAAAPGELLEAASSAATEDAPDAAPALPARAAAADSPEPEPEPGQPQGAAASSDDTDDTNDAAGTHTLTPTITAAATPEFVRRAEHAARWQHPLRRGMLAAAALLLASTLAAQFALHYRDALAAHWPAARALLQAGCELAGCRIEAPRHMQSLGVDSSSLARLPDSTLYRLQLVVQNKAATVVHMPAVELTLTDTQGHTVARRVLSAAELGQPAEQLPGGGEVTLQATLDLGGASVAGYSVELFYP